MKLFFFDSKLLDKGSASKVAQKDARCVPGALTLPRCSRKRAGGGGGGTWKWRVKIVQVNVQSPMRSGTPRISHCTEVGRKGGAHQNLRLLRCIFGVLPRGTRHGHRSPRQHERPEYFRATGTCRGSPDDGGRCGHCGNDEDAPRAAGGAGQAGALDTGCGAVGRRCSGRGTGSGVRRVLWPRREGGTGAAVYGDTGGPHGCDALADARDPENSGTQRTAGGQGSGKGEEAHEAGDQRPEWGRAQRVGGGALGCDTEWHPHTKESRPSLRWECTLRGGGGAVQCPSPNVMTVPPKGGRRS